MDIRLLCLGALCLRSGTGYDIKKLFESAFSHFQTASYGSIYPALAKLEREGLVSQHCESGAHHLGRKVYQVTDSGRERFIQALSSTPASEQMRSDYMALMFFAHLMSTETLQAKLAEIETFYQRELDYLQAIRDWPGQSAGIRFTIEQGIAVYRAKLAHLRSQGPNLVARHRDPPTPPPEGLP
jgi:PadR family transcriptional regulator AphA